jgi:hypothetical protein
MAIAARPGGFRATLERLAATILAADPAARDAVLIGSAIYAPEQARDYDIVVTSTVPAEARDQIRRGITAALEEQTDKEIDLVLRAPGDPIQGLARGILAGAVIFGAGETMNEASGFLEREGDWILNSFEEASAYLQSARENLHIALRHSTGLVRDVHFKHAFDDLFHAARIAALTFMGSDKSGWGKIDKNLPPPFNEQFQAFVGTLHVLYGYEGHFPRGKKEVVEEFRQWEAAIQQFVGDMEQLVGDRRRHTEDHSPER